MTDIINLIKKALGAQATVEKSGKDIVVKSKDRDATKVQLEKYLTKSKVKYESVFKKSKSSSIDVLTLTGFNIDIIFKPIIQKGAGGVKFEKDLEIDFNNYYNGVEYSKLKHADVIKAMEKTLGISRTDKKKVVHEGSKNKKRTLIFDGNDVNITNNTGDVLTDLTLDNVSGKSSPLYLSLKISKTYYTLNASIFKYFLDKNTQKKINEYFGFNGQMMGGFGPEYACVTKKPDYSVVSGNLKDLLDKAVGHKVILVHKKQPNDVMVKKIGAKNSVSISDLNSESYVYPELNVRKYANIKFKASINGHAYIVNMQFRGTTAADTGPKYIRVLLERT